MKKFRRKLKCCWQEEVYSCNMGMADPSWDRGNDPGKCDSSIYGSYCSKGGAWG